MLIQPRSAASLEDDPTRERPRTPVHPSATDPDAVREAVTAQLARTPGVDLDLLEVTAVGAAVTLTGTVPSATTARAATAAALRVWGVAAVADELVVHHPDRAVPDSQIAADIAAALVVSLVIPEGSVRATVAGGVVTLLGTVTSEVVHRAARGAAHGVRGVRNIRDRLVVAGGTQHPVTPMPGPQP